MRSRYLKLHFMTEKKLLGLKKEAEKDGAYRVAKRIHAVLLSNTGRTSGQIAEILHSPRSCVTEWLRNYENCGYEGLLEGHRKGRAQKLTAQQIEMLSDIIDNGPTAHRFLSGVWTSVMIAKIIKDEFSISYHPGHVRKLLYEMDFSVQRPKRVLAKAGPNKQDKWRRYTYPNIKKKRRQ